MSDENVLKLLHITDLHLHADSKTELYGVRTELSCRAVIERAFSDPQWQPGAVLVTGDAVEDCSREGYERFRSILEPLGVPILCLPGNHDNPVLMREMLNSGKFSFCGYRDLDHWRLILLNSHIDGEDGGEVSDSELQRLDRELGESDGHFALVAVHHQPIPIGSPWLDGVGLRNGPDLLSIVEKHPHSRAVIWGHVHQALDRTHNKLTMLCTPSTCAQFTPLTDKCIMDTRPPGFRRLTLEMNGSISTQVQWLEDWTTTERPPDSRRAGEPNDAM
jgi:Icc protein